MSSQRKITANRRNAGRSTGPRTAAGKARAKQNSQRHGLSVTSKSALTNSAEVKQLANAIAGQNPDFARSHFAGIAAEAQIEVLRAQKIRNSLHAAKSISDLTIFAPQNGVECLAKLVRDLNQVERYESRAVARRNRALRLL